MSFWYFGFSWNSFFSRFQPYPSSSASPGGRVGTSQRPDVPCLWNACRVFQGNSSLFQIGIKKPSCRLTDYGKFQTEKSNFSYSTETNKSVSEETLDKQRKFIWKGEARQSAGSAKSHCRCMSVTDLHRNNICFCWGRTEFHPAGLSGPQWPVQMPTKVNLFFNHLLHYHFPVS